MKHLLDISSLSIFYKGNSKPIIEDISIKAKLGDIISVIGVNGSGKTSLLKLMAQILNNNFYYSGSFNIAGNITYIPQDIGSCFLSYKTVMSQAHVPRAKVESIISLIAGKEKINLLNKKPSELSQGELQLCVLSIAFAKDAQIILIDEVFSSLDTSLTESVLCYLKSISYSKVIIFTDHIGVANNYFTNVKLLYLSKLEEDDIKIFDANSCLTFITGPNGSGKTTLVKSKYELSNKCKASYLTQNIIDFLNPNIPIIRSFSHQKINIKDAYSITYKMFNSIQVLKLKPKDLSLGNLQKICFIFSFLKGEKEIFLDEPSSYIDSKHISIMSELIYNKLKSNTKVFIAAHDYRLINSFKNYNLINLSSTK